MASRSKQYANHYVRGCKLASKAVELDTANDYGEALEHYLAGESDALAPLRQAE